MIYLAEVTEYAPVICKSASEELKKALTECAHNILYASIPFTKKEREDLRAEIDTIIIPNIQTLATLLPDVKICGRNSSVYTNVPNDATCCRKVAEC